MTSTDPEIEHVDARRRLVAYLVGGGLIVLFCLWMFATLNGSRRGAEIVGATAVAPTDLILEIATCQGEPEIERLIETEQDVRIQVKSTLSNPSLGGQDCLDVVEVSLKDPLGDRPLLDLHSSRPVNVRSP